MLPEFDLLMPQTLPEALDALASAAPDVLPLVGGTNLLVDMRGGRVSPRVLVDLGALDELKGIRRENGQVVVGGLATISELLRSPLLAEQGRVVVESAAIFANPLVRNRATVGGNLADASPAADMAPPLLVLGAEVELLSKAGTRRLPLDEFFVHVRQTARRPDELVAAVRWPVPAPGSGGAFHKLGLRQADAISVVSVAATVERDEAGLCREARIALGAVAPTPIRARRAEELLHGQQLTPELLVEAGRVAAGEVRPIDDLRGSAGYRRRMVEVLVRRALSQAISS
jgi:CO/xanthine dehydrogenase FAD-binding subunit